jgi:hypothetical protein
MNFLQILLINFFLLCSFVLQAATIQVSVDRNPINLNDSFQIIFTASDASNANPDFSSLEENFEILDRQRSSNMSWVNGRSSHSEKWVLKVLAKQAGELLIPPIAFGDEISQALTINVTENQLEPESTDELFLEVTASPEKLYVQSQLIYTVRLYRRLQITQARLDEPQLKEAVIEKLGEDTTYNTQVRGVDYVVTERKYAIFPQQSGSVTIAPLNLTAEVLSARRPHFNGFFNQQSTETRRVASKAITLNVQAMPASFHFPWLSAESVQLSENWSAKELQTKVGEPLTRTIKLEVKGSTVGQLPELSALSAIDGLKTYPDQPVLKEEKLSDGLTAVREEKIAFIPSKPGSYTLPAVEIHWFNTKTQQIEIASLPSVTLKAIATAETASQALSVASPLDVVKSVDSVAVQAESASVWQWQALAGFLAIGWLSTLGFIFFRRGSSGSKNAEKTPPFKVSLNAIEQQLKLACQENNPQAAKQALLHWGKTQFGEDSLGVIAKRSTQPLAVEIENLNQCLYSGLAVSWQGDTLWAAFSSHAKQVASSLEQTSALEPLYKL